MFRALNVDFSVKNWNSEPMKLQKLISRKICVPEKVWNLHTVMCKPRKFTLSIFPKYLFFKWEKITQISTLCKAKVIQVVTFAFWKSLKTSHKMNLYFEYSRIKNSLTLDLVFCSLSTQCGIYGNLQSYFFCKNFVKATFLL